MNIKDIKFIDSHQKKPPDLYPRLEYHSGMLIFTDGNTDLGFIEKGIFYSLVKEGTDVFKQWSKQLPKHPKDETEAELQKRFVFNLKCEYKEYVRCQTGEVDILTDTDIYEVKLSDFKKALGQLLFYKHEFPNRNLNIVTNIHQDKLTESILSKQQINVIWLK